MNWRRSKDKKTEERPFCRPREAAERIGALAACGCPYAAEPATTVEVRPNRLNHLNSLSFQKEQYSSKILLNNKFIYKQLFIFHQFCAFCFSAAPCSERRESRDQFG